MAGVLVRHLSGMQGTLGIAVALETTVNFWLTPACTFQGNSLFPSRRRSLATGCLPHVSVPFDLLAVAGKEGQKQWSCPGGVALGEEAWLRLHKSLNSYLSRGRRTKEHVGVSRSVKPWPRLSRVPDESGLPRPVPSTQLEIRPGRAQAEHVKGSWMLQRLPQSLAMGTLPPAGTPPQILGSGKGGPCCQATSCPWEPLMSWGSLR